MRVAFRLRIKPGKREEYVATHANVWPELLADLSAAGYRNYSIFIDGDDLFGYFECDNYEASNAAMARSDANRRWQAFMGNYLEASPDPDVGPATLMTEIFRLE
jgi:L-rhamnose mutarotase